MPSRRGHTGTAAAESALRRRAPIRRLAPQRWQRGTHHRAWPGSSHRHSPTSKREARQAGELDSRPAAAGRLWDWAAQAFGRGVMEEPTGELAGPVRARHQLVRCFHVLGSPCPSAGTCGLRRCPCCAVSRGARSGEHGLHSHRAARTGLFCALTTPRAPSPRCSVLARVVRLGWAWGCLALPLGAACGTRGTEAELLSRTRGCSEDTFAG